jgi:hypothetical protein
VPGNRFARRNTSLPSAGDGALARTLLDEGRGPLPCQLHSSSVQLNRGLHDDDRHAARATDTIIRAVHGSTTRAARASHCLSPENHNGRLGGSGNRGDRPHSSATWGLIPPVQLGRPLPSCHRFGGQLWTWFAVPILPPGGPPNRNRHGTGCPTSSPPARAGGADRPPCWRTASGGRRGESPGHPAYGHCAADRNAAAKRDDGFTYGTTMSLSCSRYSGVTANTEFVLPPRRLIKASMPDGSMQPTSWAVLARS